MKRRILIVLIVLVVAALSVWVYADLRWMDVTAVEIAMLDDAASAHPSTPLNWSGLDTLPAPVVNFFRACLSDGGRRISTLKIEQEGAFRLSGDEDSWTSFTARQTYSTSRPGFVWDARISMLPGVHAYVRDSYILGKGAMTGAVLGVFPLMDQRDTPGLNTGELYRYLAETIWFPSRLLPSEGVRWRAIDDSTALATLQDGALSASIEFHFAPDSTVKRLYASDRPREVKGQYIRTPWEIRCASMTEKPERIPLHCEVTWILPTGRFPYFRGLVTNVVTRYSY